MNLKDIVLSETQQAQKAKFYMILFIWNIYDKQMHKNNRQICSNQMRKRDAKKKLLRGHGVDFQGNLKIVEVDSVMPTYCCEYTQCYWLL